MMAAWDCFQLFWPIGHVIFCGAKVSPEINFEHTTRSITPCNLVLVRTSAEIRPLVVKSVILLNPRCDGQDDEETSDVVVPGLRL